MLHKTWRAILPFRFGCNFASRADDDEEQKRPPVQLRQQPIGGPVDKGAASQVSAAAAAVAAEPSEFASFWLPFASSRGLIRRSLLGCRLRLECLVSLALVRCFRRP